MKPIQILRSIQRGEKAVHKKQIQFLLTILTIVALVFAVGIFSDPVFAHTGVVGLCSTTFASMLVIGSVDDVSDRLTTGENLCTQVYLIDVNEQIDKCKPFPSPNAAREVGTIPMLEGEYMRYFQAHSIPTYIGKGDKGDVTTSGTNTFTMIMGGMTDKLLTFCEQHAGNKFIIIFKEVGDTSWKILGDLDRPVTLKSFEGKNDKDGRYITFTFERPSILQYYTYSGSLITQAPAINAADSTTLAIVSGQDNYTIPDGSAAAYAISAVSGLTANDKGRIITLIGSGTTKSATIADGSVFILEDSTTFTAKSGSKLVLRVMDANTLVEVQGSRIQTA